MGSITRIWTRYPHQARARAIVKTLVYRVFMVLITIVVAFVFTGDVSDAINIGIVANLLKTGTYYAYERFWDHIAWGISSAT